MFETNKRRVWCAVFSCIFNGANVHFYLTIQSLKSMAWGSGRSGLCSLHTLGSRVFDESTHFHLFIYLFIYLLRCSSAEWQQRKMAQNNSWSQAGISSFTYALQYFSQKDYVWCSGRTLWKKSLQRRKNHYQSALCRWHWCFCWRRVWTRSPNWKSRQDLRKILKWS